MPFHARIGAATSTQELCERVRSTGAESISEFSSIRDHADVALNHSKQVAMPKLNGTHAHEASRELFNNGIGEYKVSKVDRYLGPDLDVSNIMHSELCKRKQAMWIAFDRYKGLWNKHRPERTRKVVFRVNV